MKAPRVHVLSGSLGLLCLASSALLGCAGEGSPSFVSQEVALGRALFFDASLSEPAGQSCSSCHQPGSAFADPRQDQPTSEGVVHGLFGARQAPSVMYGMFFPPFHYDSVKGRYEGGQFWDGRAADLKDQAHFPMLAAAEMNNPSRARIVQKVASGPLAASMQRVYGMDVFSSVDRAMDAITDSIATFERSAEFAPFTSKFDAVRKGTATFSDAEARGLALFNGKGRCNTCHLSFDREGGAPPLFTDFAYHNLGAPKNPANPFYSMPPHINPAGAAFVDVGLSATTGRSADKGRMKTPTLRNVAITAPYLHNGVFKDLPTVVRFYSERDTGSFGPPEVTENMDRATVGNLGLTDGEIADLVAFMEALTDGYTAP